MSPGNPTAAQWIDECETLTTAIGHRVAYRRRGHGFPVLMLHGFPTWSYDYAPVAGDLARDHEVVTLDFPGYGVSDKPHPYDYSVTESAGVVEEVVKHLGLGEVHLVIHDYGGIVGQELLDRRRRGALGFNISSVTILNCGIVYAAYRPTSLQKLLIKPVIGRLIANRVTSERLRAGLDGIRGSAKLSDEEFAGLWYGISRDNGHKLGHLLIRYNTERNVHHERWEAALRAWDGPLSLVWGLADPVSGRQVLEQARKLLPHAKVTALDHVGHFPQSESPAAVAAAIREVVWT
ncbi:alpha/beta fold hydrolase [Amycolatopsis pithecellobii]|uniref:Alpha/beta fold hydrolase n=1 Tax=Amycolatopsis pithecellobii TaxID=664692 RepID=A0A6N7YJL6_9PSEU|nr:alpha/beta hydrolase [Amycolatopsis pithecellobii]MTD53087.1 alpha/beta fold hydrolase [Amycolatopsis pithecellobii]